MVPSGKSTETVEVCNMWSSKSLGTTHLVVTPNEIIHKPVPGANLISRPKVKGLYYYRAGH